MPVAKIIFIFLILLPMEFLYGSSDSLKVDPAIIQKVAKAVTYLKNNQMLDGAIRERDSQMFEVWETINATLAIVLWDKYINCDSRNTVDRAMRFLKSSENKNGMVLHNRDNRGAYCLETSSQYVLLLMRIYSSECPEVITKINFIKEQQLASGSWNIVSPVIPQNLQTFPSSTAFALNAIICSNQKPKDYEAAMRFLIKSQNADGCWGVEWEYYGTPFYAMVPILSALNYNNNQYREQFNKAKDYLIKSQNKDGSWFYRLEGFVNIPSKQLQTALALQSCFSCSIDCDNDVVCKGIEFLLDKQLSQGNWNGGYFPTPVVNSKIVKKREDVYATSLVLITFFQYSILKNEKCVKDSLIVG